MKRKSMLSVRKWVWALLPFYLFTFIPLSAQTVTRTQHRMAVAQDAVTTGTMTIRTPDHISISTNGGQELLMMDGTKFTMTMGGKQHVTDSRKNLQFATFHAVLKAVINNQPIPAGDDLTVSTQRGQKTITITLEKKKRQLFTSYVLVIDAKTSAIRQLRMNGRGGDYTDYRIQ